VRRPGRRRRCGNHFCALGKPSGRKPEIWAAALEYAVTRNGPHFTQEQLAEEYGVSSTRMGEHYRLLAATVDLDAPRTLWRRRRGRGRP
jgi:transcription initiation factor TFIIIB Brf1 subunit/transcription initiation factor TFIIB